MPSRAMAQKGWTMLVNSSPQARAMRVLGNDTPRSAAAFTMMGPCTAVCPPPEGTKRLTRPALTRTQIG